MMVEEFVEKKGMSWTFVVLIGLAFGLLITAIAAPVLTFGETAERLQDLNSSMQQLKQGQGVLFQGETEIARGIQDINSRIVLGSNCIQATNMDENGIAYWACKFR